MGGVLLFCILGVKQIQGARDLGQGGAADVQVDHGGGQSRVAQEHLDSAQIVTSFQKMGGEAVPQGVDACAFLDAGFFPSLLVNAADGGISKGRCSRFLNAEGKR